MIEIMRIAKISSNQRDGGPQSSVRLIAIEGNQVEGITLLMPRMSRKCFMRSNHKRMAKTEKCDR